MKLLIAVLIIAVLATSSVDCRALRRFRRQATSPQPPPATNSSNPPPSNSSSMPPETTSMPQNSSFCSSSPCLNGGYCYEWPGYYAYCICQSGWMGQFCEQPYTITDTTTWYYDACSPNPCQNMGSCSTYPGSYSYTCWCQSAYTGQNCESMINNNNNNGTQQGGNLVLNAFLSLVNVVDQK